MRCYDDGAALLEQRINDTVALAMGGVPRMRRGVVIIELNCNNMPMYAQPCGCVESDYIIPLIGYVTVWKIRLNV